MKIEAGYTWAKNISSIKILDPYLEVVEEWKTVLRGLRGAAVLVKASVARCCLIGILELHCPELLMNLHLNARR
jgi:hypothetical protein